MYHLMDYGTMIADSIRIEAYARALKQNIEPGRVVMDIGTGTGVFALLACKYGAKRVYAVEPDHIIQVARETAWENGFGDRITFIQDLSVNVNIGEKVHVIVSDLRGVLPLFGLHIPAIMDARKRFLMPGGALIPQKDTLWAAIVDSPELHAKMTRPWDERFHGMDMTRAQAYTLQSWTKGRAEASEFLAGPKKWAVLDYMKIQSPHVRGEMTWKVERPGTGHGIVVWFDSLLAPETEFSNAPRHPELIYGSAFFPWLEPVDLTPGMRVSILLQANLVDNDYLWRWRTRVHHHKDPETVIKGFSQSTFYGIPAALSEFRKKEAAYRPSLNSKGRMDRTILELMDGRMTIREIADRVYRKAPEAFKHKKEVFDRVCRLSGKYN